VSLHIVGVFHPEHTAVTQQPEITVVATVKGKVDPVKAIKVYRSRGMILTQFSGRYVVTQ
jgi:hypothetical protein